MCVCYESMYCDAARTTHTYRPWGQMSERITRAKGHTAAALCLKSPSKHEELTQCCFDIETTLGQVAGQADPVSLSWIHISGSKRDAEPMLV